MMQLESLLQALKENRLVLFIGSGFSKECGFPDWKNLAKPIAKELNYPLDDNTDYSLVFQYYQDKYDNCNKLNALLKNTFSIAPKHLENHNLLAALPVAEIWTTNYDTSIERHFEDCGRIIDVKRNIHDLTIKASKADCSLYKMHGDVSVSTECVLTKDDYENYFHTHEPFTNVLKHTLMEKTVLFIGYSLNDPDLQTILSSIRRYYDKDFSTHYWITKIETEADKRIKQELFIKNLKNYGIEAIEIDDFSEITKLLKDLNFGIKRNNIFISGASAEADEAKIKVRNDFIRSLSSELIKRNYTIFNGFGLGVGSSVIEGAYSELYSGNLYKNSRERIKLYPFYQQNVDTDKSKRDAFKTVYRKEMLKQVGVAIFIYGTKLESGKIVNSSGMEEEFTIAKENKIRLIPVCSTGGMAEKLWKRVNAALDSFGYTTDELKDLFYKLKALKPEDKKDELIEVIFSIIGKLTETDK